jgi:hypothetical protein
MNTLIKLKNPANTEGLIVIERPHSGSTRTWFAFDKWDFIKTVQDCHNNSRNLEAYDLETFSGCVKFLGRDLKDLTIFELPDVTDDYLSIINLHGSYINDALLTLGWVEEVVEGND